MALVLALGPASLWSNIDFCGVTRHTPTTVSQTEENTRKRRILRPSPKVEKMMQPLTVGQFDKMLDRAIKKPVRKPSPKSR